jgi:hypothetical protein
MAKKIEDTDASQEEAFFVADLANEHPAYVIAGLNVRTKLPEQMTKKAFSDAVEQFLNSPTFVEAGEQ